MSKIKTKEEFNLSEYFIWTFSKILLKHDLKIRASHVPIRTTRPAPDVIYFYCIDLLNPNRTIRARVLLSNDIYKAFTQIGNITEKVLENYYILKGSW